MRLLVTGGSGFIGTNLIDALLERELQVLNLDICSPKKVSHQAFWRECDIMDFDMTLSLFEKFKPTHVIHLAARTDTLSNKIEDYIVNVEGTFNILKCIQSTPEVERVIITSSQFAFGPPGIPKNDEDYNPIGAYGQSKVLTEKATRSVGLSCEWTIVRPTNIWGPWHPRYPHEFWRVLKKGYYIHPGGVTIRSYGYVKNVAFQMVRILEAPSSLVDKKVYYLGDSPIPLLNWVNGFARAITGKQAKVMPRYLIKMIAAVGTLLSGVGVRFPITLSRYRSMTEDYYSPMDITIQSFGIPPYSLEDGIKETIEWLNIYWNENSS